MYNTPSARYNRNRRSSALMLLDRSELHGHYTPTFDNDKARNFGTPARKGALKGLPVELPPIPDALLAKDAKTAGTRRVSSPRPSFACSSREHATKFNRVLGS